MDRLEKLVIQAFKPSEGRAPIGLRDFIADHYEEFAKFHSLVAQEIFKGLEEQFGLYSDSENGQLELDMIVIKPGDYYSSEDAMEKYKAFKTKWGGR
jgi:hypothetical protein